MEMENPYPAPGYEHFIHECLELALEGLGWTSPNPLVGCLLVRDGEVIGRGFHARDGEEHAEVRALRDAGDARGAHAYVSLEPCSHVGRQPSCCYELAAAGVKRVVWGCDDANPLTAGRAASLLPELGVEARGGVLREQCERLLDYYLLAQRSRRPFMHLKLALSADGKTACPGGHSQWLSGPESLGYAHFLRLKYDAALVSYRTALADDPRLTVRDEQLSAYRRPPDSVRRQPVRIVLDPRFELVDRLDQLRLGRLDGQFRSHLPRLIIAGDAELMPPTDGLAPEIRLLGLKREGDAPLDFAELAAALWELGIRSVLVEGGGALAAELLRQRLADKLTLVYTPTLIGADGLGFTPPLGCEQLDGCPRLERAEAFSLGRDAVLEGYPAWDQPDRR